MKFLNAVLSLYKYARKKYRANLKNKILKERWIKKNYKPPLKKVDELIGLDRCVINYINLIHRKDRFLEICSEFEKIGISNFTRFNAIAHSNGALGCSKSHAILLKEANITTEKLFMVCEDDCQFLVDRTFIDTLVDEFFANPSLDVLCLGYNATSGVPVSQNLMITSDTLSTSCYVIKSHAIGVVLESALKSVNFLSQGESVQNFAIDEVWKEAQKKLFFARPKFRVVKQRPSYSNIEKTYTDYGV